MASSSLQYKISRFSLSLEEGSSSSSSSSIDRFTSLFDELRLHILSLLPFKSAVRTSALSSQWRHLYKKRAQNLNFFLDAAASPAEIELSIAGGDSSGLSLDSLQLAAGDDSGVGLLRSNLRRWLSLAALRGVQDIVVNLSQPVPEREPESQPPAGPHVGFGVLSNRPPADALPFEFPATLVRLTLIGPHIARPRPSRRVRFFSLEVLSLHRVWIADTDLLAVVACCPVLGTLDIRRCRGLSMPRIPATARCLRSVTVVECPDMQLIRIGSRSLRRFHYCGKVISEYYLYSGDEVGSRSLRRLRYRWKFITGSFLGEAREFEVDEFKVEDVYVSCGGDRGGEIDAEAMVPKSNWWWSTRGMLSHVKVLTLCSLGLRYIAAKGDFLNIPCLRELQLLMKKMTKSNFLDICSFFKLCFCPGFERIFIELPFYTDMDEFSEEFSNVAEEQPAAGAFDNLKTIKMNRFSGHPYQMLLAQIFLLKAIHLESLLLVAPQLYLGEAAMYSVDCHSNALHSICMELDSMVKSENAKIIVSEHDDRRVLPTHYEVYR